MSKVDRSLIVRKGDDRVFDAGLLDLPLLGLVKEVSIVRNHQAVSLRQDIEQLITNFPQSTVGIFIDPNDNEPVFVLMPIPIIAEEPDLHFAQVTQHMGWPVVHPVYITETFGIFDHIHA